MGMAHGERIAQCEHIKLITDRSLPVQIDGGKYGVQCTFSITNKSRTSYILPPPFAVNIQCSSV